MRSVVNCDASSDASCSAAQTARQSFVYRLELESGDRVEFCRLINN